MTGAGTAGGEPPAGAVPPGVVSLGWAGIFRLGLVQTALGAIVVLATSTLNRVMVVELALPALLPGALVGFHYAVQILRPRLGYGSDLGGRRTPWILGGMAVLAAGGVLAALATAWMGSAPLPGIALGALAFGLIGVGVGACGTTLLVLLAERVGERRRAAAATTAWVMMILGFILTAGIAGQFLDPFSLGRLVAVVAIVAAIALTVTALAVWGVEGPRRPAPAESVPAMSAGAQSATGAARPAGPPFRQALAEVWSEGRARRFTVFVFISMLAYSAQDLILEPFAGTVFALTPGESTQLASVQNMGVLLGMLAVAVLGSTAWGRRLGSLAAWTVRGCLASALALAVLAAGGLASQGFPLHPAVFALGLANGLYAVAAIGSMMALVGAGHARREGVRMGLWGAAQAVALGLGGLLGTLAVDLARILTADAGLAYGAVFAGQAALFAVSAVLAARVDRPVRAGRPEGSPEGYAAETA